MNQSQARNQWFFSGLFALVAIGVFVLIRPYIGIILSSLVMVVVLRPIYDFYLQRKWVKRSGVATLLTIVSFLLIVAIPLILLINITVAQAKDIMGGFSLVGFNLEDTLVEVVEWLQQVPGIKEAGFNPEDLPTRLQESYNQMAAEVKNRVGEVVNWLAGLAIGLGTSLPNMLINLFLFLGFLITVLPAFDRIVERLEALLPLEHPITETYMRKVTLMVRSMFLGIFAVDHPGPGHGRVLCVGWGALCRLLDGPVHRPIGHPHGGHQLCRPAHGHHLDPQR